MCVLSRKLMIIAMSLLCGGAFAGVTVSDVQVFSGHPWKEILVGYTITGKDDRADLIRLTATDYSANKTYTAQALKDAKLTEGRHVLRWEAAAEGVRFSSMNVVFTMSIVSYGVQLWENGPYWAECNVGATKPEECGYYFWWGGTVGYKRNAANDGWISVKDGSSFTFTSSSCPTYLKDISQLKSEGYIDSTGNLVAAHDAATAHLGAPWRMPTKLEIEALISNCDTTWTTRNGVYGRLVTGKGAYASKSIFLPAAGRGLVSGLFDVGSTSEYRSSTPDSDSSLNGVLSLYFDSRRVNQLSLRRDGGDPVRPVRGAAK